MFFMIRLAVFALFLAGTAQAADAVGPPPPIVYGLTAAEKAQVLESASRRPDADNPALLPVQPQDRSPHGEVGVMIGTGGARGIYGVVGVPVGENGSAVLSFSNSRLPGFYGYGPFGDNGTLAQQRSFGLGLRQPAW